MSKKEILPKELQKELSDFHDFSEKQAAEMVKRAKAFQEKLEDAHELGMVDKKHYEALIPFVVTIVQTIDVSLPEMKTGEDGDTSLAARQSASFFTNSVGEIAKNMAFNFMGREKEIADYAGLCQEFIQSFKHYSSQLMMLKASGIDDGCGIINASEAEDDIQSMLKDIFKDNGSSGNKKKK